jgi:hypothetical protein
LRGDATAYRARDLMPEPVTQLDFRLLFERFTISDQPLGRVPRERLRLRDLSGKPPSIRPGVGRAALHGPPPRVAVCGGPVGAPAE